MKLITRIFFFCFIISFLPSCNDDLIIRKEFYSDGTIKKEISYRLSSKNREEKMYYHNGKLREKYSCVNDQINGDYFSYDNVGNVASKAYFKDGLPVGPVYYYFKSNLVLYNEKDFKGEVYYVKKYDSISHRLLKENGLCLSPNIINRKTLSATGKQEYIFMYAQPENYSNIIKVFLNNTPIKYDILKGHMAKIEIDGAIEYGKELKIYSLLRRDSVNVICRDSLIVNIRI